MSVILAQGSFREYVQNSNDRKGERLDFQTPICYFRICHRYFHQTRNDSHISCNTLCSYSSQRLNFFPFSHLSSDSPPYLSDSVSFTLGDIALDSKIDIFLHSGSRALPFN